MALSFLLGGSIDMVAPSPDVGMKLNQSLPHPEDLGIPGGGSSSPQGESHDGIEERERLPGRDDPDEFYKPPPRERKRLVRLPA